MAVTEKGHGYFPLYFPLWQFWRSRLICDQLDPRMPKWPNWKGKTNWAIFALSARVLSLSRPFWAILATSVHFCTDYFKNGLFPDNNKSVFFYFVLIFENRNGLEWNQTQIFNRNLKVYCTQRKLVGFGKKPLPSICSELIFPNYFCLMAFWTKW